MVIFILPLSQSNQCFLFFFNVFFILFLPCKNKGFGYMTYMWSITVKFESVAALTALGVLIP